MFRDRFSNQGFTLNRTTSALDSSSSSHWPEIYDGHYQLLPTDLEKYQAGEAAFYQKGADFVISSADNFGLLGIDVSLGNPNTMRKKRPFSHYSQL